MNIEEFVNDYLQEHRHDVLLNPYNGLVDFAYAFQEKLMEGALEAHIYQSSNPVSEIGHPLHQAGMLYEDKENAPYLKAGDRVKLIIVKED